MLKKSYRVRPERVMDQLAKGSVETIATTPESVRTRAKRSGLASQQRERIGKKARTSASTKAQRARSVHGAPSVMRRPTSLVLRKPPASSSQSTPHQKQLPTPLETFFNVQFSV